MLDGTNTVYFGEELLQTRANITDTMLLCRTRVMTVFCFLSLKFRERVCDYILISDSQQS